MIEKDIFQFNDNFFKLISQDWALLTAGTKDNFNTMTIGWATIGYLWGKNVVTCYVRPTRYTYQFMETNDFFTISFFDESYRDILNYLGTNSGRNIDKITNCDLNVIEVKDSIAFEEARMIIVCKKIYHQDFDQKQIPISIKEKYYPKNDNHRLYIGEIIHILENQETNE